MASKSKPNQGVAKKPAIPAKKPVQATKAVAPVAKRTSVPAGKLASTAAKSPPALRKAPATTRKVESDSKPSSVLAKTPTATTPKLAEPAPLHAPVFPSPAEPPPKIYLKGGAALPPPLTLSVQTSAGNATAGSNQPANILVLVTSGGWPVTDLNQDHFTLMQHFDVPGKMASFSNNIVSFRNAGSGAYLLQTRPNGGAPWTSGQLLGQLLVSSPDDRQGQAALKFIIR